MTKRSFLCLLLAAMLLLCACGRAEEAATTAPPTSAAPTTVPPTTAVPVTKAPEPETVISYDFHLESLPDIGKHQKKSADCFYDEPLREFEPSGRYGTLIPYRLDGEDRMWGEFERYGFMTAEGKIVTAGIFNRLYCYDVNGKTVFLAQNKVLSENPETIPDWETDREGAEAAYQRAEDYYDENVRYYLISADGRKCLTLRSYPQCFRDDSGGAVLFSCAQHRSDDDFRTEGVDSFTVYDADLEPVADLTDYLEDYDYAYMTAAGENRFVLRGERYPETEETLEGDLLFFENGELDHILETGKESYYRMEGRFVICEKHVYDEDGKTVYEMGDNYADTVFDPRSDCLFLYHYREGKLVRIDRGGRVQTTVTTLSATEFVDLTLYDSGSKSYLVIPRDAGYDHRTGYLVYDVDLKQVCEIGSANAQKTAFCYDTENRATGVFLVSVRGRTDIFDVTGQKTASLPFGYEDTDRNYNVDGDPLIYFYRDSETCAVYDTSDRSVTVMPAGRSCPRFTEYFSEKLLCYSGYANDDIDSRGYVIQDLVTGEFLLNGISSLEVFSVGGKVYLNYIKNEILYVCDGDLNVIASLYNDALV